MLLILPQAKQLHTWTLGVQMKHWNDLMMTRGLLLERKAVIHSCLVSERTICFLLCVYTSGLSFEFFMSDLKEFELRLSAIITVEQRSLANMRSITWYRLEFTGRSVNGYRYLSFFVIRWRHCGLCMIRGTSISLLSLCMALKWKWSCMGGLCILGSGTKLSEIICQISQEDLRKKT